MQTIKAIGRIKLGEILYSQNLHNTLLVDTYNGAPLNMEKFRPLNPFFTWSKPVIPVPGGGKRKSRSVEAIWQGCKLINGKLDYKQLLSAPYKRPSESDRESDPLFSYQNTQFIYNEEILSHLEARYLIYFTSYLYLLNEIIPNQLIREIKKIINDGSDILFVDWDNNFDINNINASFSHSTILSSWFGKTLKEDFLSKATAVLSYSFYKIFTEHFEALTKKYNHYVGGKYDS